MIDPLGLEVFYNGVSVNSAMQRYLNNLSEFSGNDIYLVERGGRRNNADDSKTSQHYTGNAADFFMKRNGELVDMTSAAYLTADSGEFTRVGYYNGQGKRGAHVHADLKAGAKLYWSETDKTGLHYNSDSEFWNEYHRSRKEREGNKCGK